MDLFPSTLVLGRVKISDARCTRVLPSPGLWISTQPTLEGPHRMKKEKPSCRGLTCHRKTPKNMPRFSSLFRKELEAPAFPRGW